MNRVEPWHQTNWDWRAAGNFIGGGSGTGLLILAPVLAGGSSPRLWTAVLLGLALVGAGLFCVWLEIGRPLRAVHVYFQPQRSWMTREAFVALPLFGLGLLAVFLLAVATSPSTASTVVVWALAAVAALYLFCQTQILRASRGIPAWRHPSLPSLIGLTGLTEGTGLLALLSPWFASGLNEFALALIVMCFLRGLGWRNYQRRLAADGAPNATLKTLSRANSTVLFLGHGVPLVFAVLALGLPSPWAQADLMFAGLTAVAGGWAIKYVIVARAAYNQGFALPQLPVRGGGSPAPGVKPGWNEV